MVGVPEHLLPPPEPERERKMLRALSGRVVTAMKMMKRAASNGSTGSAEGVERIGGGA